jgi:pilus assembly protein TadC
MDHKILFVVSSVAVVGLVGTLLHGNPNMVKVAVLITMYAMLMGLIVAVQSRHWRWAVAILLLGLPATFVYASSRLRYAEVEPLSALPG